MQCLEEYIKDNDDLRAYETLITFYENNNVLDLAEECFSKEKELIKKSR